MASLLLILINSYYGTFLDCLSDRLLENQLQKTEKDAKKKEDRLKREIRDLKQENEAAQKAINQVTHYTIQCISCHITSTINQVTQYIVLYIMSYHKYPQPRNNTQYNVYHV